MMRTQEEIKNKLKEMITDVTLDPLGFKREALYMFASYENLKSIGNLRISRDMWEPIPLIRDDIVVVLKRLLNVAYNRVIAHNMISVSRSFQKIEMYLWVLGDDEAIEYITNDRNFTAYGLPIIQYLMDRYINKPNYENVYSFEMITKAMKDWENYIDDMAVSLKEDHEK